MALPARLFCDTSFFYACFDQHDVNHEQAKQISEDAATVGSALFVTWDIISETVTLLRYRRTYREALTFLTEVKPHLRIVNYGEAVRTEAEQISDDTAVTVELHGLTPVAPLHTLRRAKPSEAYPPSPRLWRIPSSHSSTGLHPWLSAKEGKLSFCDAVSFVVVTTLLDDMPSLAFDTAFRALGLTVIP